MSVLDEIKKLDEKKAQLLSQAKQEALQVANAAIKALNELGFNYQLVQGEGSPVTVRSSGTRRTGIRDEVLATVQKHKDGISRSQLLEVMQAKGDKSAEQSISNALAALKKDGKVSGDDGIYKA